jgi:phage terminase large subunit-like protein
VLDTQGQEFKDKLAATRLRCLSDLYFLVTEVLYWNDIHKYGPFHKWMADTVGKTPGTRELWLVPRDHFKTTILTIGHGIQQILRDPGVSLLVVSRKDEHALLMSEEMRRQFVFNERMRSLFPGWCSATLDDMGSKGEWTSPGYKIIRGKRRREHTVTATGIKSTQQSRHYKWGYFDDCMDAADTTEVGLREIRADFKELIPLIDNDGGIIIPGTRKHYNDIYQAQMDTGAYKVYVRHGLEGKERCKLDECSRYAEPHNEPQFKTGTALCPERMKREDYDRKLRECEIDPKSGVSFFYHEYMNIPFSPSDRKFQPRWFVQVDDGNIPGLVAPFDPLTKWIAVDTALKEEEHPSGYDYTCIVVGGFDEHGRLFILDILRDRHWTAKKFCEAVVTCMQSQEYGGISRVITEKVADNISWHDTLRGMCRAKGVPLMLLSLTRGGGGVMARRSKYERIEATQGHFEQGRVFFRRKSANFEDCVNEFCNLRRWTNDDIADAISMFFDERVIVMPPHKAAAQLPAAQFHPMPFDGPARRAAFRQVSHSSKGLTAAEFLRNGQLSVDGRGGILFTKEQADLFATRPDKKQEQLVTAFRPMR